MFVVFIVIEILTEKIVHSNLVPSKNMFLYTHLGQIWPVADNKLHFMPSFVSSKTLNAVG